MSKIDFDYDIYSLNFYPSICFIEKENYEKYEKRIHQRRIRFGKEFL